MKKRKPVTFHGIPVKHEKPIRGPLFPTRVCPKCEKMVPAIGAHTCVTKRKRIPHPDPLVPSNRDPFDSPEGQTQSCDACILEKTAGPHRCCRREITDAEREFLYQWLLIDNGGKLGAAYDHARTVLRAERAKGGKA